VGARAGVADDGGSGSASSTVRIKLVIVYWVADPARTIREYTSMGVFLAGVMTPVVEFKV
jgi:hypothetical protein